MKKYDKGTFIVVPNQQALAGLNPIAQTIFMWLCFFANQNGNCFPSRKTLADRCGVTDRAVDKHIKTLERAGLVERQVRTKDGMKNTNLYTVTLADVDANEVPIDANDVQEGSEPRSPGGSEPRSHRTQSSNNSIHLTQPAPCAEDVPKFIHLFREINPAIAQLYSRPPQRSAAERLLKLHPLNWWERFMAAYHHALEDRYCPRATTPLKLEEKLGDIEAYGRQRRADQTTKRNNVLI